MKLPGVLLRPHPSITDSSLGWSRPNAHTFSLKSTRLIQTPANMDNGQIFQSRLKQSHTKLTSLIWTICLILSDKNVLKHAKSVSYTYTISLVERKLRTFLIVIF